MKDTYNMSYASLKVDFRLPSGKIDFITLHLPACYKDIIELRKFEAIIKSINATRIKIPKKGEHFTLHDPSRQELQALIDAYPELEVLALEVSLDFSLQDGSNDAHKLETLRSWLVHHLNPEKHERLRERSWRKYYDVDSRKILRDTMRSKSTNTVYWGSPAGHQQVRLYVKTMDNKIPLKNHTVRLEVTLFRGGCQYAGVNRLAMLPGFANNMRKYLGRFFSVAKSIKPAAKRVTRSKDPREQLKAKAMAQIERNRLKRSWDCYGVKWAVKKGYRLSPDGDANRWLVQGLKKLRVNLMKLSIPASVAEKVAEWETAYDVKTD